MAIPVYVTGMPLLIRCLIFFAYRLIFCFLKVVFIFQGTYGKSRQISMKQTLNEKLGCSGKDYICSNYRYLECSGRDTTKNAHKWVFFYYRCFNIPSQYYISDTLLKKEGWQRMISYEPFWKTITEKNISTYALINKFGILPDTIQRLRSGRPLTTTTINTLCEVLECEIGEILEYRQDTEDMITEWMKEPSKSLFSEGSFGISHFKHYRK